MASPSAVLRLGSLRLGVEAPAEAFELLPTILRKRREDLFEMGPSPDWAAPGLVWLSPPWRAQLFRATPIDWLRFESLGPASQQACYDALVVLLHRALGALECFYVHAGGVVWKGRTRIFVGQRGAGKTTTCLMLARLGGELLADDHLLLRRREGQVWVSGEDPLLRLTEPTVQHFFPHGVEAERNLGKLELLTSLSAAAGRDHPIDDIFLVGLGERLECRPVSRAQGLLALIEQLRYAVRIDREQDAQHFLDSLAEMVEGARVFRLQLSRDLNQLESWCREL